MDWIRRELRSESFAFAGPQIHFAWSGTTLNLSEFPILWSCYLSSSGLLSWVGFIHTHTPVQAKILRGVDPEALVRLVPPSRHFLAPKRLLCQPKWWTGTPPLLFFSFIPVFYYYYYYKVFGAIFLNFAPWNRILLYFRRNKTRSKHE
jgi:hypothetical protein